MLDLSTIQRCADITDTHVTEAAKSREDMRQLLLHAAKISRPSEGAPKVLRALARMSSADWVAGDLRADVVSSGDKTEVDLKSASGGVIERVFPTLTLDAPLDEFVRAVHLVPRMIEPLLMFAESDDHLVFVSNEALYHEPPLELEPVEAEEDFSSLNLEAAEAIPEREVEKPVLASERRPFDHNVHTRKTEQRMPAISRDAIRSDVPPPKTK